MRLVRTVDLLERARKGDHAAVGRLITLVENDLCGQPTGQAREIAIAVARFPQQAMVLGITGPPGVGKSTTTSALVAALRAQGDRIGVLAVDPSSPFSGGAVLGDRIRMGEHSADDGVFIRSMATRGQLGGLAAAVPMAVRLLDTAGCDWIIVETVGVGQSEIDVMALADTTLVILAPGMGDGIQAAKAGILEIADLLVVNKADRQGADQVVRDLRYRQNLSPRGAWRLPIVKTVASRGDGLTELLEEIRGHRNWLDASGEGVRRRIEHAKACIVEISVVHSRQRFGSLHSDAVTALAHEVVAGRLDPFTAADRLALQR
jgi:LAO/AO transport system ATPase